MRNTPIGSVNHANRTGSALNEVVDHYLRETQQMGGGSKMEKAQKTLVQQKGTDKFFSDDIGAKAYWSATK